MSDFINKLNYKEDGHLISDEVVEIKNSNRTYIVQHHNIIEENGVSIFTQPEGNGELISDFAITRDVDKPFINILTFGSTIPNGTYYLTYYSQGDENDADDINKLQNEIINILSNISDITDLLSEININELKRLGVSSRGRLTIDGVEVDFGNPIEPEPDTTPPNNVTNLQASNIKLNELRLSWLASDSNDVVGYDIYKDGVFLTYVTTTSVLVSELLADTEYTFSVRAKDGSGNVADGTVITVMTSKEQEIESPNGNSLIIVSHYDDDTAFEPDIQKDIQEKDSVTTLYLSASDAGKTLDYVESREEGMRAVYAYLANVPNNWKEDQIIINGRAIRSMTLDGTNVRHIYLRLPDGNYNGTGFVRNNYDSLQKLWENEIQFITTKDNVLYNKNDILSLVSEIIDTYEIDSLKHMYHLLNSPSVGQYSNNHEHSDHIHGGYIAYEGAMLSQNNLKKMIAYGIDFLHDEEHTINLTQEERDLRFGAISTYQPYDENFSAEWLTDQEFLDSLWYMWRYPYIIDESDNDEDVIVLDGLVSYYNSKKGVTDNVWNNISPNTNGSYNGVINGATINQDGMYFDGIDDYVEFPMPSELLVDTSFTIEFMLNEVTSRVKYADILSPSHVGYMIYFDKQDNDLWFDFYRNDDDDQQISDNGVKYFGGKAYFTIVLDINSRTSKLFKDGILVDTSEFTTGNTRFFINEQQIRLGTYSSDHPQGVIDCLRIYNRALTTEEVVKNYQVKDNLGLGEV